MVHGICFRTKNIISGKANDIDKLDIKVGDTGHTLSSIRPSGIASIRNQRIEVHSEGTFIESGTDIQVHSITKNKIYIKIK